jgi:hypothetical protein
MAFSHGLDQEPSNILKSAEDRFQKACVMMGVSSTSECCFPEKHTPLVQRTSLGKACVSGENSMRT